ncbi:transmembrane protease serine 9-like [Epargyreus clarus]|uniref:transmembrane protease serine 9-like n=1 Tax=Epargyreus clarus TaxID=520877 RepID=UPI003C2C70A4
MTGLKIGLLVIPISVPEAPHKTALSEATSQREKVYRKDEFNKLDIENYEEPTEMPNIDNYDYSNYRGDDLHGYLGDDKIVGGVEVESMNLYPYHVAYGSNCGGAIISKKWVITAGHCGKKAYIRVGSKYINQGRRVGVKKNYIHPLWSAKKKDHPFDYDYQLLELSEPLKFDDNVQPIKIAHIEDMTIGKVVTVTGWGNTEENGPYSNVLRAVRVPIISKENCQHVPFPYFRGALTQRMFCAGYSEGKKDACQGDSGGPAVAYDRLLGMVSFGYGCATPGSFGVYSKVAKVRSWISEVTAQLNFVRSIIGGHDVTIDQVPYQVNYGDICGGVLIHKKWAITTAHCGAHKFIRVGSRRRLRGPRVRVVKHLVHPRYGIKHKYDYDVQLLGLMRRLFFSKSVSDIEICDGDCGEEFLVSGWGYPVEKGDYADILQQVQVNQVAIDRCQAVKEFWYNNTLTSRMFCAGDEVRDACQGDSGGGAVSRGMLAGISSFGIGCGRVPGIYTNISHHEIRTWIRRYTGI